MPLYEGVDGENVKVGVTAVQGDVSEHLDAVQAALRDLGVSGHAVPIRRPESLEEMDALIVPGGESTTISKLLHEFDLADRIVQRAKEGMPLMGTCAGCILLAKEGDVQVASTDTRLLGLMDMAVDRNAYGGQRESFEAALDLESIGPMRGVFIRAPAIRRVWGGCRPLGRLDEAIVMARQDHLVALTFHPELSPSTGVHRYFLELV
ncbi:MAG: pyridoxal 5'-phosphate synthase glutaminase subunit PdxT [Thermoplasmata archaeon]|nr:pyridoxal 5'-phosphate synthase glutaminase subunit PdxT [Thermoplasmata archaeon]